MPLRIATGGVLHETSTFAPGRTGMADFERGFGLFRGQEMIARFRGANTCVGGFIDGAAEHAFELVPLLWTFAYPSGLIVREVYESLKGEFLDGLRQADQSDRLDGVLLDLHGAMVVEGIDDADGDFIAAVRQEIGRERPLIVTTDLHANHTRLRVEQADAIVGYDTYPHIDMAERGREAATLLANTLAGRIRPVTAIAKIPLFWSTACQVTAHPPMNEVLDRLHELENRPGMLSATIATGFPWADVPDIGPSVLAVADASRTELVPFEQRNGTSSVLRAQAAADELAGWIWEQRQRWHKPPMTVREALAEGERLGRYPIILADHADNTGGGAAGDSTEILRTFLDLKLRDALILYIVDPEVAEQAQKAGVGVRLRIAVGGKSHPVQGPPLEMNAEVMAVSEGGFKYDGPMFSGLTGNMGRSAWLRQDGVSVVVVTAREQPLGPAFARTLGIDCAAMRYIAVKSAAHFRAAFEPIAGSIYNVDAQAIHTHDFAKLPYQKRSRQMYPVDVGS